ncbi:MAG: hypothetical protein A3J59_00810 [Candidatus Buchananbacteria bacterium RIFCSPHIGHO2_02_FULL_56_16]|uniref:Transposase IS200-like domain-containing protein n=2 Tax=Candidatus Buchananiibacteriota TaxID=1817903 RepID=A0A1G1YCV5_9BACT|nr:MAG: hypothetical protein A3J59_00810 [Candidatus Buchananbacteria bacterium RIFCSPHIGHO2_02_FULL_56_16]
MPGRLRKYHNESYVHFVTTVTFRRQPYFRDPQLCQILAANIRFYQQKFSLEVYGWVIMPDHLHLLVWWDVEKRPELTVSKIVQGIKGASARQMIDLFKNKGNPRQEQRLLSTHHEGSSEPPLRDGRQEQRLLSTHGVGASRQEQRLSSTHHEGSSEPPLRDGSHRRGLRYQIWQPGFYDFNIYTQKKLQEKIDYLKTNVINAGLADDWQDYRWIYLKYD